MTNLPEAFKGGTLPEQIPAAVIEKSLSPETLELRPPISLMGDIQVSSYGAVGFTLLDSAPENRIRTWNSASDYYGLEDNDAPEKYELLSFEEASRYYDTRHGFKVVRYAIIPEQLGALLDTNKWVGPAVIRQALEDGVAPREWQEEPIAPGRSIYTSGEGRSNEEQEKIFQAKAAYLIGLLRGLDTNVPPDVFQASASHIPMYGSGNILPDNHYTYISFHPWVLFGGVSSEYPLAVRRMLTNIDSLMRQFVDRDGSIASQVTQELTQDSHYLPAARLAVRAVQEEQDGNTI